VIHFTCDCCKRTLDSERDLRYVVRLEVYASMDVTEEEIENERDHLQEIQDILEHLDDADDPQIGDDVYQQHRYDLCSDCRKRFVKNPLGRINTTQLDFSQN